MTKAQFGWRGVGATIVLLVVGSCEGSVSSPAYLPELLPGTYVGEITEVGPNLSGLGPTPGVIEILVEERPRPTGGSCLATIFGVSSTADVSLWRRAEELRSGTTADLKTGTLVRVLLAEGPCFGSCPGICGAKSVQVFER